MNDRLESALTGDDRDEPFGLMNRPYMWKGSMRSRERIIDEMLVIAAQAGQVEAFDCLAARWHPRLLRHAWRLTGDPEGAHEAAQEAWMAVARGLWRLKDPACFGPWALRIVSRRCADWIKRRRHSRQHTTELAAAFQAPAPSGEQGDQPPERARGSQST